MMPFENERKELAPDDPLIQHLNRRIQQDLRKKLGEEEYREFMKKHCPFCLGRR